MDGRQSRGRGGGGKRGGRGGHDGESHHGEHRGRGRGGHHRGRGRREHYRGRGQSGGGHAADFSRRDQDEADHGGGGDHVTQTFSRRKLESNWAQYEASEAKGAEEDAPTQRGTDFGALLLSAGDSFTQFRFADEKDWEMDSFVASQMSAFVDLSALAQSLQQVPLHDRLNLEAQLIQISAPAELPLTSKQEASRSSASVPALSVTAKAPGPPRAASKTVVLAAPLTAPPPAEDEEEELDELLSLREPAAAPEDRGPEEEGPSTGKEEPGNKNTDLACEEVKRNVPEVAGGEDEAEEGVRDERVTAASVKKELTEEELEDWLDSMIS